MFLIIISSRKWQAFKIWQMRYFPLSHYSSCVGSWSYGKDDTNTWWLDWNGRSNLFISIKYLQPMQSLLLDPFTNSLQILKQETDSWTCKLWFFSSVKVDPPLQLTVPQLTLNFFLLLFNFWGLGMGYPVVFNHLWQK